MKLNFETIQKMYEFGGLLAYEVQSFDPLTFKVNTELRTFSESKARKAYKALAKNNQQAQIVNYWVHFDGAYAN